MLEAVAVLVTFRLTLLIVRDDITKPLRDRVPDGTWFGELVRCHYCASVWVGWAVAALLYRDLNALWVGFALSAATILLVALLDHLER